VAAVNMVNSEMPRSRSGGDSLPGAAAAGGDFGRVAWWSWRGRERAGGEVRPGRATRGAAVRRARGAGCWRCSRRGSTSTSFFTP
jgi:hypothetical protein